MRFPRRTRIATLCLVLAILAGLAVFFWSRPKAPPTPAAVAWSEPGCAEILARPGRDLPLQGFPGGYSNADFDEQRVYLLCASGDTAELQGILRGQAMVALGEVDFDQYVVIVVFDGIKGNTCPGIAIERVRQDGTTLVVYAKHWGRPPNLECGAEMKNPLSIVMIPRDEQISENAEVMLCTRLVPHPTPKPR